MINRRQVREISLKALYAFKKSGDSLQHVMDTLVVTELKESKESRRFAEKLIFRTIEHEEQLIKIIESHTKNWDFNRLAFIDQLVLQLALCEFLYFEEIPTKVTINEAIEIVKRYSTGKSGQFVNGILDAALEELVEKGEIKKKGRGLIDTTIRK